ncbi:hypothetical protein [Celeribacter neptunius]|uniref:Uncharacterized protein n=1 Tax=Celeribacter neptunius TaxID=588602 RepID=A0A1I3JMQ7_9RHOB|nr:hypothetical protein [Celeribacter neptunius]SFI61175.1 hypothetical protein SAMN04487991_0394 [Celeribacter neptunius]
MKQVFGLYALVAGALCLMLLLLGPHQVLALSYGAIALMALMISATFLWLWSQRATPLALGMALSWAGSGLTMAFWASGCWARVARISNASGGETILLLLALALLIAGAVLHFSVIQGTFGLTGLSFLWPVMGAFFLSFAAVFLL